MAPADDPPGNLWRFWNVPLRSLSVARCPGGSLGRLWLAGDLGTGGGEVSSRAAAALHGGVCGDPAAAEDSGRCFGSSRGGGDPEPPRLQESSGIGRCAEVS